MIDGRTQRRYVSSVLGLAFRSGIGLSGTAAAPPAPDLVNDPAALGNPLIGTSNAGNTLPAAVRPLRILAWSPQNSRSFPNDADKPYAIPTGEDVAGVTLPNENRIRVFAIATG